MTNTLQRAYDAVNRGSDRGMQRASQLQQLFAQKDQMERQKEQDEFVKAQTVIKNALTMLDSDSFAVQESGLDILSDVMKARPGDWGGKPPDVKKAWSMNRGTEELADIEKAIKYAMSDKIPPSEKGPLLTKISGMIGKLPTQSSADTARTMLKDSEKRNYDRQQATTAYDRKVSLKGVPGPPKEATPPTTASIEAASLMKWMNGTKLTPQEQILVDNKIKKSGKSSDQIKQDAKARIEAKVESFKELTGKVPSPQEIRAMIINDPWGFLEESGGGDDRSGWKTATNKAGEKMYQNPQTKEWEK